MGHPSKIRIELEEAICVKKERIRYHKSMRPTIDRMATAINTKMRSKGIIKPNELLCRTATDQDDINYFYAYNNNVDYGRTENS